MKKPNFFIIGAPKCGTTSLAAWLGEHPQIFMSYPKEIYFFCTDFNLRQITSPKKYLHIFQNAGDQHLAVGEASVFYLISQIATKKILEFNPAARFIVMLRNPIDMAQSYHGELLCSRAEVIEDFEQAWQTRCTYDFKPHKSNAPRYRDPNPTLLQYDKVCKLGEQVQHLLQTVNTKSVLFIIMDDLISDPLTEYQRVLKFLDVPYDGKTQFPTYNSARRPRYKLINQILLSFADMYFDIKRVLGITRNFGILKKVRYFNEKQYKTQSLRPEFRQELIKFFKEDIELLSSLLNRDFSNWLR